MKLVKVTAVLAAGAATSLGLVASSSIASASTAGAPDGSAATTSYRGITFVGVSNVRQQAQSPRATAADNSAGHELAPDTLNKGANQATSAVPVPNPRPTPLSTTSGGVSGFVGITHQAQRLANDGNQFSLEPPDQGLCAHGGVVIEAVNNALQVFTESGSALSPVIALHPFFHLPPEINRTFNPPTYGPFLSDPKCYFDPETSRWFVTELEIDTNPYTGATGFRSSELLAVSQTSDPLGNYGIFQIDSTNDGSNGTPAEANCPCFGDQPRIGADLNGFYISTDSYPIHGSFNSDGGELYALSKTGLAAAATGSAPPPVLVDIHNGAVTIDGYPANAVQPAQTPEHGSYAPDTEYFMSTPDFNGFATTGGAGARAVVVWALKGTASLNTASPNLKLSYAKVASEPYAPPVPALQRPGPTPLGTAHGEPLPTLNPNDDRMQQVEYVAGRLYSSLNTGVGAGGTADRTGSAWFVVQPAVTHAKVGGTVTAQGYVALAGKSSTLFPSIGLNPDGTGAMAFSVSGPGLYPSAAHVDFEPNGPSGQVKVQGQGHGPEDGFSCYKAYNGGPCRWGDYSAASSDGSGHIVMANEMIPDTARTTLANWGTFIGVLPS